MTQPGTMVRMDVDELYGLPFDEFVPARNALTRELRKAGKRDEAAEVSALRKPSVAAWAVDQLVPASGTRAMAAASIVSATRSSGSRLCRWDFPHARASVCASKVKVLK